MALHALLHTDFSWEHRKLLQLSLVCTLPCPSEGWQGCSALFPMVLIALCLHPSIVSNCPLSTGPSLKTLCKLAVIQYSLDQSCLPHDIRYCVPCWEVTPWVRPVLGVLQP